MATTYENAHDLLKKGYALYEAKFNAKPQWAGCAPGRVNLIGEHVDYNDGFVLPMCLPVVTVLLGSRNNSNQIHLHSDSARADKPTDISFDIPKVQKLTPGAPKWANYVKGVVSIFNDRVAPVPGFNAVILSSVPMGSGLSSSAALEVATYTFLESITDEKTLKLTDKALACQEAEHSFAGVPCGIMDQYVSVMGEEGSALLIDCKTHEARHIPLGDDHQYVFLIINSNVHHELSSSEYAVRRAQCKSVLDKLHRVSFRDVSLKSLEDKHAQKLLSDEEYKRGHHVVTEIDRTYKGANALKEGDFETFGKLMNESHDSLRDDYEVSCKELDDIAHCAQSLAGVLGCRMTGGGFGGCAIALVHTDHVNDIIAKVKAHCVNNPTPTFFVSDAYQGATHVSLEDWPQYHY
ncbi:hypothetical protein M8J75_016349 [Diaphorina citri]|nr:hypothetical protein M8J75_016349 [Diaphorina citri]